MSDAVSESPRRLYLDNAATTFPKPRGVAEAFAHYFSELGSSPGRGAYAESVEAARLMNDCRRAVCKLFHGTSPEHVIFTLNCSDALNIAIKGLIDPAKTTAGARPHAICTDLDHNSILRPLNTMLDRGWIDVTRVPVDPVTGRVDPADIRAAVRRETRIIAVTHASNVTGTVQPIREIGRLARECAVPFVVDAAQSAGHVPIDVQADCIDLLAAPGHKFLMGPLGTGVLYLRPGMEKIVRPLREGGTGSVSENDRQPELMPDKYECGSHNAPGIMALLAGVNWVLAQGVEKLHQHDTDLVRTFLDNIAGCDALTYYGPRGVAHRIGVFSVRVPGLAPHELSAVLEAEYGILTRSGLHCAPHAHATIGTLEGGGATRLSFGPFLSRQDVKFVADSLTSVALQSVR
jgi:cysteine desulfurase / selenocysteine lyase